MPALCTISGVIFTILTLMTSIFCIALKLGDIPIISLIIILAIIILLGAFVLYYRLARRNGLNAIKSTLSFVTGFVISAGILFVAYIIPHYQIYHTWQSGEIVDGAKIELKTIPTFCPEFYRRIAFKSGKKVDITLDPCGLGEFNVYRLSDGKVFLRCTEISGFHFLLDTKNETVEEMPPSQKIDISKAKHLGVLNGIEFTPENNSKK